ncbi:hypothetical protein F383_31543 [Gossypium arboreum]|uniref:Uncharacterized protein n=1 Tax=Gossypium arboreum TaxID=29729 RepID=A0A0B0N1B4_GOSAR|nr:hypothetical protein F383_31543 [Gossypium arboreum]
MEKSCPSNIKFLILLLTVSSMMFSMVPRTRGQIHLPCSSEDDCKAIECQGGTAHCINRQCQCTTFQINTITCFNNFECLNKCGPKSSIHRCVNGRCIC